MMQKFLKIYLLAGLVMFCLPHGIWNNLFGVLYALIGIGIYIAGYCRKEISAFSLRPIGWAFPAFAAFCLLSCLWAPSFTDALRVGVFFAAGLAFAWLFAVSFRDPSSGAQLLDALQGVLLFTSVYGFIEFLAGQHRYYTQVGERILVRLCSTMEHPNNYGVFVAMLFPICLAGALEEKTKSRRVWRLIALVPPLAALALTYSRTGWLALAVGIVWFLWFYRRKWLLPLLGAGVLGILAAPSSLRGRLLSVLEFSNASSSGRFTLWRECLAMGKDYWLRGVGLGTENFSGVYADYSTGTLWFDVPHANMLYLDVFCALGIVGLVLFCLFFFGTFLRRKSASASKGVFLGLQAALVAFTAASVFEQTFFYPRLLWLWCILFGFWRTQTVSQRSEK